MEQITYRLDVFEGPLDLLLSLITKNKIDIHDIPIVMICDQYMEYIRAAQHMDMDLASDFIIMASELMLIKSKMLLPRVEEDAEDPRAELANALELYIAAKNAAEQLKPLYELYHGRMEKETDEIPPEKGYPLGLDPEVLTRALNAMIARVNALQPEPELLISPLIRPHVVSVEEKIAEMLTLFEHAEQISLFYLLKDAPNKPELLARFMGVLELIKMRRILLCETLPGDVTSDPDLPDAPDDYNYTSGLTLTFRLNPDFDPETQIESEFDRPPEEENKESHDSEQGGNDTAADSVKKSESDHD